MVIDMTRNELNSARLALEPYLTQEVLDLLPREAKLEMCQGVHEGRDPKIMAELFTEAALGANI